MLAVEEKLNELLDVDGGINKRKVSSYAIFYLLMYFILWVSLSYYCSIPHWSIMDLYIVIILLALFGFVFETCVLVHVCY